MNFPSEIFPFGGTSKDVFNWSARDLARSVSERSGTEPENTSIAKAATFSSNIRLGNADYFGGSILKQGSDVPLVVSGNAAKSNVMSSLKINNSKAYISGLSFIAPNASSPLIEISNGSVVVVSGCVFRFVKSSTEHAITMDSSSKLVVQGCFFYGGNPSARIVLNPGVMANLVISTSYQGYGVAWSTSFTGIGNI